MRDYFNRKCKGASVTAGLRLRMLFLDPIFSVMMQCLLIKLGLDRLVITNKVSQKVGKMLKTLFFYIIGLSWTGKWGDPEDLVCFRSESWMLYNFCLLICLMRVNNILHKKLLKLCKKLFLKFRVSQNHMIPQNSPNGEISEGHIWV